jgi:hypothetical protein
VNGILERLTALALWAVVALLGWVVLAAYLPGIARMAPEEVEVVVVLALLSVSLGLVSLLALLHSRPGRSDGV